jgi:hypothetical protein
LSRFSLRRTEQFNGREGETATLLFGLSVSFTLRVGGFAPRHLKRWAFSDRKLKSGIAHFKTKTLRVSSMACEGKRLAFG